ncbi:phosphohistidine phosphatase SixA [Pseudomonas sp. GCM10022188]|uniref:phosphohistidine phosphatase SixA n=1 Tax=Pseudomonas TaxID=286 RepID=UPI001E5FC489|nr:phosphohistidine phosphatase SixA [Pseudomonas oryzagri]MCC6075405.1 phosphohistidine phosphatase SixA [Pseudomonas oryzagri]
MKTLFLVRHGQSSWDDVRLADSERPLTDKGKNDAAKMGRRLAESDVAVDALVSSPAQRALATANAIAKRLEFKRRHIVQDQRLYTGQVDDLLQLLQETDDEHKRLMLVGHNPLLSELVLCLSSKDVNLPTCAVAVLRFDTKSWMKIGRKKLEKVAIKYS